MKDSRIESLEHELKRRNDIIRHLERELDKYRSVLQPAVATQKRNQRQGISAEPQSYKNCQRCFQAASETQQKHQARPFFVVSTAFILGSVDESSLSKL